MKLNLTLLFLVLILIQCNPKTKKSTETIDTETTKIDEVKSDSLEINNDQSQIEKNLINFITNDYLKKDLDLLQEIDRKFQYEVIDLNGDGNDEIFVRFMSPYFCGTGGCNFLLLDKYGEIITNFSVTRPPIWVETEKVNNWFILLVKDHGDLKELKFENGTYPSNPSIAPNASYDAPSGHARVLFDENFGNAKTVTF